MGTTRNVVLFGECGVGKSSIINTIIGKPVAKTSNDVIGCTDQNTPYTVTLDTEVKVNLWDTIGLDEGTAGRLPANLARERLKLFLQSQIETSEGVDLLLYCIRGAGGAKCLPVKQGHWDKYKFVFEEVCKKRLPIALIVTHLESYDAGGDMDTWWKDSEGKLSEFGFQFCTHACITLQPPESESRAASGDANRIEVSRHRLQDLLSLNFLAPRNILLLGDREDRDDFIDMTVASHNKKGFQCVPPFTCITIAFDQHTHVNFWNMTGIDETDNDTLVTQKNLKLLVQGIKQTAGIDLLLFCFRAGRPKVRHVRNYNLFHAAICRKKLPVAIVVLGPKEEGAKTWWERNERDLRGRGFLFDRHVYIPSDACRFPSGDLDADARRQLIDLVQEEHTLGSWKVGNDTSWVTVSNVRAVVGGLSWPKTTVVVCDTTKKGAFAEIAPSVETRLRSISSYREHQFRHVDPQTFSSIPSQSSGGIKPRTGISGPGNKSISLIMFFMSAEESGRDNEAWRTLENFHHIYKGSITPLIVVIYGVPGRCLAEDFWRAAPRHIRRRIGACLTYHPGPSAHPEAQVIAEEILANMIQDRCLVDLGEKVGILREILSVWRKYRSAR